MSNQQKQDTHSEYSPSRLKGIIACPGVVQLTRQAKASNRLIEQQNSAAAHGTMLHGVMESIIQGHGSIVTPPDKAYIKGHIETLDFDDQILINWALERFYGEMCVYSEDEVIAWGLELEVSMQEFGFPQVYGTSDVLALLAPVDGKPIIHGWDWKFGRHRVFARDNHQLQAYKHGGYAYFLEDFESFITPDMPISMHIVQPAIEHYDRWDQGLDSDWCKELHYAIESAESQDPLFNPSEENCMWCKCRAFCKARLDQVQTNAQMVFEKLAIQPEMWSEDDVQFLLGMLGELESVRKGILEDYEQRLKEGKPVKGFKLVQGQGRRQFIDFADVIEFLDDKHPEVEAFVAKPKSPAQLEKELPLDTRRSAEFQNLIHKVHGIKMVRDDADGEAILRGAAAAQEAFKEFA